MDPNELKNRLRVLIKQVYSNQTITPEEAIQYDELTKFPELKKVIVDLLTAEYDSFLASIDWVAPRPTTFRINLKNDQNFYLIYGKRSWIAQVEGKKYYLLNIQEEERAMESLARILRYGGEKTEENKTVSKEPGADLGGGESPILTPSPETLGREPEGIDVSPEDFETPSDETTPEEETPEEEA